MQYNYRVEEKYSGWMEGQDDEDGGFACYNVLAKKWSENQLCRESEQLKYQLCII